MKRERSGGADFFLPWEGARDAMAGQGTHYVLPDKVLDAPKPPPAPEKKGS